MTQAQTVAVYGGSFDPPHIGHMMVAAYVLGAHPVSSLLVIPTNNHPFGKALTPFEHRMHMCELAFSGLRRAQVSRIEQQLGGVSTTVHTLRALQQALPTKRFRLVVGSDLLATLQSWHAAEEIERLAPPLVVQRSGAITHPDHPAMPAVSSTELRESLKNGEATEGRCHPQVAAYARSHRLYGGYASQP